MAEAELRFGFTQRLQLDVIRDPLGLNPLKSLETALLEAMTSQTRRLEYHPFTNWVWWTVKQEATDLHPRYLERVLTAASVRHHPTGDNPAGIAEFDARSDDLDRWEGFSWEEIHSEYQTGRPPHGEQYHRGPLRNLRMVWGDEKGDIRLSRAARRAAEAYKSSRSTPSFLREERLPTKDELAEAADHCFCGEGLSDEERDIWTHVLLGFREGEYEEADISHRASRAYLDGETDPAEEQRAAISEILGTAAGDEEAGTLFGEWSEQEGPTAPDILRRYSILLVLRIAEVVGIPESTRADRQQQVRDAVLYGQAKGPDGWGGLRLPKLEPIREAWAVLAHNLYHISAMEAILEDLVEAASRYPKGIPLTDLPPRLDQQEIQRLGDEVRLDIQIDQKLAELANEVSELQMAERVGLERQLQEPLAGARSRDQRWLSALLLQAALKHYRKAFNQSQERLLRWSNPSGRVGQAGPVGIFSELEHLSLADAVQELAVLVFRRHLVAVGYKYRMRGTRAWLLVEDEGRVRCFDPKKGFDQRRHPESRINASVELLADLGLLKLSNGRYVPTEEGERWLAPLK